jgi:Na+/H+ antiporter NhaD/arsenite permease-like protein
VVIKDINPLMVSPFVLLLAAIAIVPFINRHWWEKYYPMVSLLLGAIVVTYYAFFLKNMPRMLRTAEEYLSFISLIGSLFVVTGGILIRIEKKATPWVNSLILWIGAIISNIIGTTGASALFIRPFLRVNKNRIRPYHVVFFIFVVSNIGGALTPMGDPPLFLGYLKGVPYFWVLPKVWYIWAITLSIVISIFYLTDRHNYLKLSNSDLNQNQNQNEYSGKIQLIGAKNLIFLAFILIAVFLDTPIREAIMIASAVLAYRLSKKEVLKENEFNFHPIREVAILFAGIFATMVAPLDWLELHASELGIKNAGQFYWGTGVLSSLLDNAPTYLNFLSAAFGLHHLQVDNIQHMKIFLAEHWKYAQAISVSSVFFGANTYIGNGPNFMVKSISEHLGVKTPSFFGYVVKYSLPILIPTFALVWLLFFR